MPALPALPLLPAEFAVDSSERTLCARHRDWRASLEAAGYSAEREPATRESALTGRKPLQEFETAQGTLLLRRFTHGGLLRAVTGSRFQDPLRPFHELVLAAQLAARGIGTPRIVGARARAAAGGGWLLDLALVRVEGARDLEACLREVRERSTAGATRLPWLRDAGAFVRELHEAGLLHIDLTTKNLLLQDAASRNLLLQESGGVPRFFVLDLDRSQLLPRVPIEDRERNLRRLLRFVLRRESRGPRALHAQDYLRFLAGYEPARAERRRLSRSLWEAHRRSLGWHQIGWGLERMFRG